ncbi:MAG: ABC transporter permease [Firmicutes bacterium]|nr:ABC transporter permease [Bacillota bacterium]
MFLLILMIAVAVQMSGKFATVRNATNILQQIAPNGIVAVGLTLVSITGGLDMSTGSVMALTGVITMMQLKSGSSLPIAILSGSMVGVLTGFVNGVFVGKVKISPFIMTLATQTLVRGIALGITDTYPVSLWHPGFAQLSMGKVGFVPYSFAAMLILAILSEFFLKLTKPGHNIYVCGSNQDAGYSAGINMEGTQILAYTLCGLTASIAGIFLASKLGSGSPVVAGDASLLAMTAIIIGGNKLGGSKANLLRTTIGVLVLGVLNNMMNLLGTMSYIQTIIKGLIVVVAIGADAAGVRRLGDQLKLQLMRTKKEVGEV